MSNLKKESENILEESINILNNFINLINGNTSTNTDRQPNFKIQPPSFTIQPVIIQENIFEEIIKELDNPSKTIKESNHPKSVKEYINLAKSHLNNVNKIINQHFSKDISKSEIKAFEELKLGLYLIEKGLNLSLNNLNYKESFHYFKEAHIHLEESIKLSLNTYYQNNSTSTATNIFTSKYKNSKSSSKDNSGKSNSNSNNGGNSNDNLGNGGSGSGRGGNKNNGGFWSDNSFEGFDEFIDLVINNIKKGYSKISDVTIHIKNIVVRNVFAAMSKVFSIFTLNTSKKIIDPTTIDIKASNKHESQKIIEIAKLQEITNDIIEKNIELEQKLNNDNSFILFIQNNGGNINVNNSSNDNSKKNTVDIGRDSFGAAAGRDIRGDTAVTIGQLEKSENPEVLELAKLLKQIKEVIEKDSTLNEEEKESALEAVQNIAKAGKNSKEGSMKKLGRNAIRLLKGMIVGLPATTKFDEVCTKNLPEISNFFN